MSSDVKSFNGMDWSEIKKPARLENETLDEYYPQYNSLPSRGLSAHNLGVYQERSSGKLKSTKYIGVVPFLRLDGMKEPDLSIPDNMIIKVSSRFGISATEMLRKVLSSDEYYNNPKMLITRSYKEKEWKELAGKDAETENDKESKIIFGVVSGIGQIDLSQSEKGAGDATDDDLGITEGYGIFEIIDFVNKAKEVCKGNLKKQSQRHEENLVAKVRGRILVQKQIKYNETRGQKQKVYCAFNKMSDDIKENQIIKYALHLCLKNSEIGESLSEDIRLCLNTLRNVPLKKCGTSDFIGLKNNGAYRQYKDVLIAAKKVISRYSITYSDEKREGKGTTASISNHKVQPFFIDMNLLFEYYCRAIFEEAIDEVNKDNSELVFQLEGVKDAERELGNEDLNKVYMKTYIPDIVVKYTYKKQEDKIACVIDAKYSPLEEQSLARRERTHQILFYMKAMGCDFGGLISPSPSKEKDKKSVILQKIYQNGDIVKSAPYLSYIPIEYEEGKTIDGAADNHIKSVKEFLKELRVKICEKEGQESKLKTLLVGTHIPRKDMQELRELLELEGIGE